MRWVWDLDRRQAPARGDVRPGDEPEIRLLPVRGLSLAAKIMAETWEGYITRDEAAGFLRRALGQGRVLPFVAYVDGHPVGSALAVVRGRTAELFGGVHVIPGYRRRGIGSAVLRAVLRHCRGLGVNRLYVAREMSQPPTEDDIAAAALYDKCGGERRRPLVEVVYSPQCPWWAEWLEGFREEVAGADVDFEAHDLWDEAERSWELLKAAGVLGPGGSAPARGPRRVGGLVDNVFARVFVDGEPVGEGVPLPPDELGRAVRTALGGETGLRGKRLAETLPGLKPGVRPQDTTTEAAGRASVAYPQVEPRVAEYARALEGLTLKPLLAGAQEPGDENEARARLGIDLCLERHPAGGAPRAGAASRGAERKTRWLESLDLPGGFYGVAARRGRRTVGLAEVYPRDVAARAGFVTGTWGTGEKVLTLTCLEVARGESRYPVMEFLVEGLLRELPVRAPGYTHLEAWGLYGNGAGFNPYWLLDKYGFARSEERRAAGGVIMSREIERV